jgi:hypothetical protein
LLRGHRVLLDADLAALYGVTECDRFPEASKALLPLSDPFLPVARGSYQAGNFTEQVKAAGVKPHTS